MVLITAIQALNELYRRNYKESIKCQTLLEKLPNGSARYFACFNRIKKISTRINLINMRIRAIENINNRAALNRNTQTILQRG